jgi:peptidoglycan/LPS O-acetylase OafA/YrhL
MSDWIIAIGGTILIIIILCYGQFIVKRPIQFLGNISYSLYLLHTPIIKCFIYIFGGHMPILIILIGALTASIIVAYLSYKFIELPFIELGKKLIKKTRIQTQN